MRKTLAREKVLKEVNHTLSLPFDKVPRQAKRMLCCMIESILMRNDSYRGFKWNMPTCEAAEVGVDDPRYYNRTYF